MLIFGIFQDTLWSKYTPKRTKLNHIFQIFLGKLAILAYVLAYACNYN